MTGLIWFKLRAGGEVGMHDQGPVATEAPMPASTPGNYTTTADATEARLTPIKAGQAQAAAIAGDANVQRGRKAAIYGGSV